MRHEDFFTGEVVEEPTSHQMSDEEVASQFASFGQYHYGPQQNVVQPGLGGYNPYYGQYQAGAGNPAFDYMRQQGMVPQQPQVPQGDITLEIPPVSLGSEYLPPKDYEQTITNLQSQYYMDLVNQDAKQTVDSIAAGRNPMQFGGYNYYGQPMYSTPYNYNYYIGEYKDTLDEMKETARENRTNFNISLAKLARNFSGMSYDEQVINEMYHGKTVTVPGITYTDIYETNRLDNLVPFDNSAKYREADAKVTEQYRKYIPADANMQETFENMGLVDFEYRMEEEKHRRRASVKEGYDSQGYKYLIKKTVMDRYAEDNNITLPNQMGKGVPDGAGSDIISQRFNKAKADLLNSGMFSTLQASGKLADDGSLHINYTYDNINENMYKEQRDRFNGFLQSIPDAILDGGGDK